MWICAGPFPAAKVGPTSARRMMAFPWCSGIQFREKNISLLLTCGVHIVYNIGMNIAQARTLCLIAISAISSAHGHVVAEEVRLELVPERRISIFASLDELDSMRGEGERYVPCDIAPGDVAFTCSMSRRAADDACDMHASVTNLSSRPRFLRLTFRVPVPFSSYTFWNGYLNQMNSANTGSGSMSSLFPAIAAISSDVSLALGMDPRMMAARVDTSCVKLDGRDALEFAFPVYLPPGDGFSARMAVAAVLSRYLWHDVVEKWYGLFHEAFSAPDRLHPGVFSAEASYMFWKPESVGITNRSDRSAALRKVFGNRPCWDWCYKPFVRGGDWAITDRWCVGWHGFSAEMVERTRAEMRMRTAEGETLNVAPMWYLNVCWTEKDMGLKEFPGIVLGDNPIISFIWQQDTLRPVYCAGGTPYEELFRESIVRIPVEYPASRGIAWDSCFANAEIPETHIGFNGTRCKSFRKGVPFAHEAMGICGLLDLNHAQSAGTYRMANAVNYKLVAPWMIGVRTDTGLYEGTPMTCPERLWRLESLRARLGPRKILSWHKGCSKDRLAWARLDAMPPEEQDDAHRQIMDDILFLCYYWGTVPAGGIRSENRERLVGAIGELIDLIKSGWHPSPACDVPGGILVARYGEGTATRLAVINPSYAERDVDVFLPEGYWPEYKHGRHITVTLPARQVVIADPATGESRPAATLPPAPVKKVFTDGLMPWMARNGLLGMAVGNDKSNRRK